MLTQIVYKKVGNEKLVGEKEKQRSVVSVDTIRPDDVASMSVARVGRRAHWGVAKSHNEVTFYQLTSL